MNDCAPQQQDEPAAQDESEESPADEAAIAEEPVADQAPVAEAPDSPAQPNSPAPDAEAQETEEELQERFEFVRASIAKENQRKLDERKEKVDQARKKVQELNARFADWYYVVSDSVYRKLTLSREQLITTAAPESSAPADGNLPSGLPEGFPSDFQFPQRP